MTTDHTARERAEGIAREEYTELMKEMRTRALAYATTEHPQSTPMLLMRGASGIDELLKENSRITKALGECERLRKVCEAWDQFAPYLAAHGQIKITEPKGDE